MKKAKSDEVNAKARVQQYASMDPLPYSPIVLSDEEEMAFDELIEHNDEEEPAEEGGEGEPTGLAEGEEEGHDLAVGAAAVGKMTVEKMTKEETAEVEKKGKKPFGATTSEKARKEKSEKVPSVGTPTVEMKEKGPVTSTTTDATPSNKPARPQQKEKKKQVR